ncbi:hypothetical protein APA_1130 [Pseudanabaena sp. lw0831]|nr:hypothetical protein APA_1130 [Pseudanabaena sp. lw0831]
MQILRYFRSDRPFIDTTDLVKLDGVKALCSQTRTNKFFKSVALQHF